MLAAVSTIQLQSGPMRAALRADLGASIAGLWLGDVPVLCSVAPHDLQGPRDAGCFPLVPYSNRIARRRFTWQGREHELAANFGAAYPHSIHGSAWQRAWSVEHADERSAVLRFVQTPDAHWPFAFDAEQRFELSDTSLRIEMALRNTDAATQPAGLGWHPYFPKRGTSRIHVECSACWERDAATHLPTRRVPHRGIDAEVRHLDLDNGFEGWPGSARVRDEQISIAITSSLAHLVIYTPPSQPHFCIEPVSHAINAIAMDDPAAHGIVALEPGATLQAWMRIDAAPR
jgi:aldose 1-epimerase